MKVAIVQLSEVLKQPNHSMAPQDYIADPDYIKLLLIRFTPADQVRLRSLIDRGVVTKQEFHGIARELQAEVMAQPRRTVQKIVDTMARILK